MNRPDSPTIVMLCGGVGGAKMAEGFVNSRFADNLSVIGNVADDQEFHGLWVSPDIDTLTYTLTDNIDRNKGWGLFDESNRVLDQLKALGADTWMYLGDKDFAIHILRTQMRSQGVRPTEIARRITHGFGLDVPIILPTDDVIQNQVKTENGWIAFQDYFVKWGCQPDVLDCRVVGIEQAQATPEALHAIAQADMVVIAPSNPIVSIHPILAIPGMREALELSSAFKVAVSPLVAGQAVKGPADKMMLAAGYRADVQGVADFYTGLVDALVIDQQDRAHLSAVGQRIEHVLVTDTLMFNQTNKVRLAESIVHAYQSFVTRHSSELQQVGRRH
ncbi:MAG: 2-phospho-L-lactate transferase [Oceanospirillales bacterium]|nr:2-phospho-L-lactate transferase [Oceanospirillales bacterium]